MRLQCSLVPPRDFSFIEIDHREGRRLRIISEDGNTTWNVRLVDLGAHHYKRSALKPIERAATVKRHPRNHRMMAHRCPCPDEGCECLQSGIGDQSLTRKLLFHVTGATCFPEIHAAEVKQTVIAIENAMGRIKRYLQLTTVTAAKERANAHAVPRMSDSVATGRPPNCQANIAAKR